MLYSSSINIPHSETEFDSLIEFIPFIYFHKFYYEQCLFSKNENTSEEFQDDFLLSFMCACAY